MKSVAFDGKLYTILVKTPMIMLSRSSCNGVPSPRISCIVRKLQKIYKFNFNFTSLSSSTYMYLFSKILWKGSFENESNDRIKGISYEIFFEKWKKKYGISTIFTFLVIFRVFTGRSSVSRNIFERNPSVRARRFDRRTRCYTGYS